MAGPSESDEPPQQDTSTIGTGVLLGIALQLIQFPILLIGLMLFRVPMMLVVAFSPLFIGVTQLLYIVPAIVHATNEGFYNQRKGLIIAASVVALLNVTCWAALPMRF